MIFNKLKFGSTIGIIGGGQLGKMMAQSAQKMGYKVIVLDPDADCPCQHVAHQFINAKYDDLAALESLGEASDVITYEFENISANQLQTLVSKYNVPQGYEAIQLLQDRLTEKETLQKANTQIAPFVQLTEKNDITQAVAEIGYPFIVKTRFGGYDGKGQQLLHSADDVPLAKELFAHSQCIAEGFVPFTKEISVIVQRNGNGETCCLPVGENIHVRQILHETIVPARIDDTTAQKAEKAATKIADYLNLVGTVAVEMFVLENGDIIINELAPRPHNSGHYSIEACNKYDPGSRMLQNSLSTALSCVTSANFPRWFLIPRSLSQNPILAL